MKRSCPDGGTCHHSCVGAHCWRTQNAGPLSGVYSDDRWPDYLVKILNGSLPPGRYRGVGSPPPGEYIISQSIDINEWGEVSIITHEMGQ